MAHDSRSTRMFWSGLACSEVVASALLAGLPISLQETDSLLAGAVACGCVTSEAGRTQHGPDCGAEQVAAGPAHEIASGEGSAHSIFVYQPLSGTEPSSHEWPVRRVSSTDRRLSERRNCGVGLLGAIRQGPF